MSTTGEELLKEYGHKPSCNNAGNPSNCTCAAEAEAHLKMCSDALAARIDGQILENLYRGFSH